jgi:hypothetical protein
MRAGNMRGFDVDYCRFPLLPKSLGKLSNVFFLSGHHTFMDRQNDLLKAAVQASRLSAFWSIAICFSSARFNVS